MLRKVNIPQIDKGYTSRQEHAEETFLYAAIIDRAYRDLRDSKSVIRMSAAVWFTGKSTEKPLVSFKQCIENTQLSPRTTRKILAVVEKVLAKVERNL